jgi:hypothetical protein
VERLAETLAELVSHGLATPVEDARSIQGGKQAFRALADETRQLYTLPTAVKHGNHEHPRRPS